MSLADDVLVLCELPRSQVEIAGKDRAALLHGLCTNDIKRLQPGEGCEAFLTNVQGKTIGHAYVFCGSETLVLDSVAGEAAHIIRNLDRYVVREDVRFVDRSTEWRQILLKGASAGAALQAAAKVEIPGREFGHVDAEFEDGRISLRRTPITGKDSFQISGSEALLSSLQRSLVGLGAQVQGTDFVEVARIEAGTPLFGRDITPDNLPQEVNRDAQAISFTKGCYLGQETVARIDALGHVNRVLVRLKLAGSKVPPSGSEVTQGGKVIAKITSSCFSPRLGCALALAYVRRGHHEVGTRFLTDWGDAEVFRD